MIKARPNSFLLWFYSSYFWVLQRLFFRKMSIRCESTFPEDRSVLLLQNHFSYYDPYWSVILSRRLFGRKFHAMMLEEQLARRMFLTRCGAFSVRKNSRELLESINYAAGLLQNPANMVVIYPSGEILSHHRQNFPFQRGFARLVGGDTPCLIALAVVLVDHFSYAKPEVRIYVENYVGEKTAPAIENAYQRFYQSCILKQTE